MKIWLEIISEWLVNISAGWFAVVLVDPVASPIDKIEDFLSLTPKLIVAILSLILAKVFRQWSRDYEWLNFPRNHQ